MVEIEDIVDPNFTQGLPAEIHLDYTREGMLGERAHTAHVEAVAEVERLTRCMLTLRGAALNVLGDYDGKFGEGGFPISKEAVSRLEKAIFKANTQSEENS